VAKPLHRSLAVKTVADGRKLGQLYGYGGEIKPSFRTAIQGGVAFERGVAMMRGHSEKPRNGIEARFDSPSENRIVGGENASWLIPVGS